MRGHKPFALTPGQDVVIGRGETCDLSVTSSLLSREHACVRWEGGLPVLFDMESMNGCYRGPDKIARHYLSEGDLLRLGDFMILVRESPIAPQLPPDVFFEPPADLQGVEVTDTPQVQETQLFSRNKALSQKVFAYDELGWLCERLGPAESWLGHGLLRPKQSVEAWVAALPDSAPFQLFLRLGILAPPHLAELDSGLPNATKLTQRGERLLEQVHGKRVTWNEMAALRYRLRHGQLYHPLRHVARAYRPGGGLAELQLPGLIYELEAIYAAELEPRVRDLELRRLLCLGFLAPAPGRELEAFYPREWGEGAVEISERGRALLEGFRVEE